MRCGWGPPLVFCDGFSLGLNTNVGFSEGLETNVGFCVVFLGPRRWFFDVKTIEKPTAGPQKKPTQKPTLVSRPSEKPTSLAQPKKTTSSQPTRTSQLGQPRDQTPPAQTCSPGATPFKLRLQPFRPIYVSTRKAFPVLVFGVGFLGPTKKLAYQPNARGVHGHNEQETKRQEVLIFTQLSRSMLISSVGFHWFSGFGYVLSFSS